MATHLNIERLAELAKQATPGPWRLDRTEAAVMSESGYRVVDFANGVADDDTVFLAACDPQTILALCAEVERMRAVVEGLRQLHLCDDDEHNLDCKRDHGEMILPNPEGCAACRVFAALDSAKEEKP